MKGIQKVFGLSKMYSKHIQTKKGVDINEIKIHLWIIH